MKKHSCVMIATVCLAVACGGGENQNKGSTTSAAPPSAAPPPAGGAAATTPSGGNPQPITGKTWDVKMLGDANSYRFDPPSLTIKSGDGVRWTVVTGIPHNVTFWPDSIPQGAASVLQVNMPQQMSQLSGPLLTNPSQTYTVSFAGAPAGTYHYYCTPHLAFGMKGVITVQ